MSSIDNLDQVRKIQGSYFTSPRQVFNIQGALSRLLYDRSCLAEIILKENISPQEHKSYFETFNFYNEKIKELLNL